MPNLYDYDPPSLSEIFAASRKIAGFTRKTPVVSVPMQEIDLHWPSATEAVFKLELLQVTGTFKPRGAANCILGLTDSQRARGVTAVSAGNHAIAVAYAAKALGVSAKVVMIASANPTRIAAAQSQGAEIELAPDGKSAFSRAREIEEQEGRYFVHPFEGPATVTGTATVGLEWFEQSGSLDAIVVACGGGGLLAGVAAAMRQQSPVTMVYGVEPEGADCMYRSFASGQPTTLPAVSTIADSLAPPMTTPYTYSVCRRFVQQMVRVSDAQIRSAMRLSFNTLKLAVEPAGATALAGALGPLRGPLGEHRRIGILVCGANIDPYTFHSHVTDAT